MRVVALRCGWMHRYEGESPSDDGPIGGGSYTETKLGHERFNFKDIGGHLYAYFQSPGRGGGLNLRRIKSGRVASTVKGVTVLFVATHPQERGQRIIGWYKNATAYARFQPAFGTSRSDCGYQVECDISDAVLLPLGRRTQRVPTTKGGMSQTHVRYPLNAQRELDIPAWMTAALDFVNNYNGPNLLQPLGNELEEAVGDATEAVLGSRGQGGFQQDSTTRKAIEEHAMQMALQHYESNGWQVQDTHTNHPFDYLISKGDEEVRVEVKGTTGDGSSVVLTRGEVQSAEAHPSTLFIVHGISVSHETGAPVASGGEVALFQPWKINQGSLTPISYFYRPPGT